MRTLAALTLAAALAAAPVALAQEPPKPPVPPAAPEAPKPAAPAKHENKISAEAKALFDAYEKAAYSPIALGLKEMKGTLVMKTEMPGMEGMEGMQGMPDNSITFTVDFKAPRALALEGRTANPMMGQMIDQMKQGVRTIVLNSLGLLQPAEDQEYDADVVTEAGGKVLVLKPYDKGVQVAEMRMKIDANGLPTTGTMTAQGQSVEMEFQYAKDGDRFRLEKQIIKTPMLPEPIVYVLAYADAGGFKVVTSFTSVIDMGGMQIKQGYRYTDLSVNGKKVEIPTEGAKKAEPGTVPVPTPGTGGGAAK